MITIPEMAIAELDSKTKDDEAYSSSKTIFIAGNRFVGKSTAINNFLDKPETTRETLALEYSYGRKSSQKRNMDKIICHIWEYGGNLDLLSEVIVSIPHQGDMTVFVMVDLGKPKKIWPVLETCFLAIDKLVKQNSAGPAVVILGGMYDVFKNFETEIKKTISTTIRCIAMLYNAYILYYSTEDPVLVKKLKQAFNFFGFRSGCFPKEKSVAVSKPLCLSEGMDSWESIGMERRGFNVIKSNHLAQFPTELEDVLPTTEPSTIVDTRAEPILDALKKRKLDELIESLDVSTADYIKLL